MSLRSVYLPVPSVENDRIHITGDEHRHLTVARAGKDEVVEIFDGTGRVWTAAIESVNKRETVAHISQLRRVPPPSPDLILAMAMIRIPAFELALEKTVEVGVTRIVPFTAARSNVAPGYRHERWTRILIEAAKQSKRYHLPGLDPPASFMEVLSIPAGSRVMFAERGGGPLRPALTASPALYLIGPEGGWTDEEMTAAGKNGFAPVSLRTAILKAETAAIVGAALIRYEWERGLKLATT
jgi:16S rRNA (uracil1498-N3)-methyltransferase